MKKQLLEDFGDSASEPVGAKPAAVPKPPPRVWRERATPPRPVWRARAASSAPPDPPDPPSPPEPPPPPTPPPPEPAMFADERLSFAAREPHFAIDFPATTPTWSERWGRRLLGWSAGAMLAAAAIGVVWWMVQDRQVVTALALVADQSAPAAASGWREPEPAASAPPALVMLPAEPVPEPVPEAVPEPAAPSALEPEAPPTGQADHGEGAAQAAAEAVRRAEARRAAARQETAKRENAKKEAARKEAARHAAARDLASREATRQAAARAAAAAEPSAQQAETLRQCRAAGYHASQCIKRGCIATKYGLACRG